MSETKSHAKMILTVDTPSILHQLIGKNNGSIQLQIIGCQDCLVKALTELLLTNEEFKNIVNKAVRAANEIRAQSQN